MSTYIFVNTRTHVLINTHRLNTTQTQTLSLALTHNAAGSSGGTATDRPSMGRGSTYAPK